MYIYSKQRRITSFLFAILVIMLSSFTFCTDSYATELNDTAIVTVDEYQISNDKIVPGEDFTLTLTLKNYSKYTAANNVVVDISFPNGVAPVYGTVAQGYIDTIKANGSETISFSFNSFTTIDPDADTLDFSVFISADQMSNSIVLRVPCGSDAPFSIVSTSIPSEAAVSENVEASITFKVLGNENVSNMSLVITVDNIERTSSYIGIMTYGATKTQTSSVAFDEPGVYEIGLELVYTDASGITQHILASSSTITVSESGSSSNTISNGDNSNNQSDSQTNNGSNTLMIMGVSGVLIVLICFIIVILVYRKKR